MFTSAHFNKLSLADQINVDIDGTSFPTKVISWVENEILLSEKNANFGFVAEGEARLTTSSGVFSLTQGMFFSISENAKISGGKGLIYARKNFSCQFYLGGPCRKIGPLMLRYIDGASCNVLIHPEIQGYPVLNSLFLPPHTYQTMHVHPDIRVGYVYQGSGTCYIPSGTGNIGRESEIAIPLLPGDIFYIPADGKHRFVTDSEHLLLIPWHAYSEDGVHDDRHYTLDRSIVRQGADGNDSWLTHDAISGMHLRKI